LAPDRAVGHRTWENFLAERVNASRRIGYAIGHDDPEPLDVPR
jgi:hypothetical protein